MVMFFPGYKSISFVIMFLFFCSNVFKSTECLQFNYYFSYSVFCAYKYDIRQDFFFIVISIVIKLTI